MFLCFKKWTLIGIASMCAIFLLFGAILHHGNVIQTANYQISEQNSQSTPVLIIDAGHGGEDGGAVASDGTVESGINLAIALQIEKVAQLSGWETVMTRRQDISIHDPDCETLRQKKVSDLKNRAALCANTGNGILISIHQNSLPQSPSVHGAQVFYNGEPGSQELAQAIQDNLNSFINYDSPKAPKAISSDIYLMENAQCPAILVECGFLSNRDETINLKNEKYQKKISSVIFAAAADHLSSS